MREILFKAKRWSDGKWVYGDLNQLQDSTIIHWYNNGCRVADEVDPSTVCQYTGLTDKNGKKILRGISSAGRTGRASKKKPPYAMTQSGTDFVFG